MNIKTFHLATDISEEELKATRKRCSLRRADRYTAMALFLANSMLEKSGAEILSDAALITVSAFGPLRTTFSVLDDLLDYPEDQILPTRFSHSVHNAAASYVGIQLGLTGPAYAVTGFDDAWFDAVQLAGSLLATGTPEVLLLGVEEHSQLTPQLTELYPVRFRSPGAEGGAALLLDRSGIGSELRLEGETAEEPLFHFGCDPAFAEQNPVLRRVTKA